MKNFLPAGLAIWLLILATTSARAAVVTLEPVGTRIGLTIYAMGLFPQAGHFTKFNGTLSVDPGQSRRCHVDMQVEVASLAMSTEVATRTALGPGMLDAAHFPALSYQGDCDPAHTVGQLTLHGVTRTLALTTTRGAANITANGSLHRQDYAIRGMPGLVGGTVHIVFSVDLPRDLAQELQR